MRDPEHGREAFELIRSLVQEVRLAPTDGELCIELNGQLSGILALAEGALQLGTSSKDKALQIKMVAGARNSLRSSGQRCGFLRSQVWESVGTGGTIHAWRSAERLRMASGPP